jgi:N-acetylglucosamine-6-phosphate deacetylase
VEVIPDFVHVDKELVKFPIKAVGEDRLVSVTDSIKTTGLGDGEYSLGKMSITVKGGRALTKYGKLAGCTLTMDTVFVNLASLAGLRVAMMTSYNPARAIGLSDKGIIMPGKRADLVVLDEKLRIVKVFVKDEEFKVSTH